MSHLEYCAFVLKMYIIKLQSVQEMVKGLEHSSCEEQLKCVFGWWRLLKEKI